MPGWSVRYLLKAEGGGLRKALMFSLADAIRDNNKMGAMTSKSHL